MPQQIYDRLLALGKAHDARLQQSLVLGLQPAAAWPAFHNLRKDSRLVTLSLQAKVDGLAKVPRSMRRGYPQPLLTNGCEQLKEHDDGARCKVVVLETEARSE